MKTKVFKIMHVALWICIGIWYIPSLLPGYGQINCGGTLPNGTMVDGFCPKVYFLEQWWLILLRIILVGTTLWGVIFVKNSKTYNQLYPYAIAAFLSLSIVIRNIAPDALFWASIPAGIILFCLLSAPWWGSKMILKGIEKKIKKSK